MMTPLFRNGNTCNTVLMCMQYKKAIATFYKKTSRIVK